MFRAGKMEDNPRMAMYEAQAIAIEQQAIIERLEKEKADLEERLRRPERDKQGTPQRNKMTNDALLKMYEAQAIAIERQTEIDKLNKEKEEMTERLRKLELSTGAKSHSSSSNKSAAKENLINIPEILPHPAKKLPEEITILLIGESRIGKSTFVNAIANYLKYETLQEAQEKGVEILIKTSFTQTDSDYNKIEVLCNPTVNMEGTMMEENEIFTVWQNITQHPRSYKLILRKDGQERIIHIIDTPGVYDFSVSELDIENARRILSFLTDFKKINAICVLLKPNEFLTVDFHYTLTQMLSQFHVSAAPNILFCFTNARSTLFRPEYTLPTLEAFLKGTNTRIPLNLETMYCFDNESFRYLCALKFGVVCSSKEIMDFNTSWAWSSQETKRLFQRVAELEPLDVQKILDVNNIRSVILAMPTPLEELAGLLSVHTELMKAKTEDADAGFLTHWRKDLERKRNANSIVRSKPVNYIVTVCTAEKCVEYICPDSDPTSPTKTFYKTRCHEPFYLQGVSLQQVPNPEVQHSPVLRKNIQQCEYCGCPWTTHTYMNYVQEKERVKDPIVKLRIKFYEDIMSALNSSDKVEQKKLKNEVIEESEIITRYCSAFALYLKKNSILPYNSLLRQPDSNEITAGEACPVQKQTGFMKYIRNYQQLIQLVDETDDSDQEFTTQEIYRMLDQLRTLKHTGKLFTEHEKLEMLKVRENRIFPSILVNLTSEWLDESREKKKESRVRKRIQTFERKMV